MIVCWGEGHGSAIHDHAGTHCFMKMLQGELREIRYEWPTVVDELDCSEPADISFQPDANGEYNSEELQEMSRGTMELNSVRYINGNHFYTFIHLARLVSRFIKCNLFTDNLGLHRVENASHTDAAVSLHLYCPPYSSCSIFNQKTGKQTKCNVTFYSQFGKRKDKVPEFVCIEFGANLLIVFYFFRKLISHLQKITRQTNWKLGMQWIYFINKKF